MKIRFHFRASTKPEIGRRQIDEHALFRLRERGEQLVPHHAFGVRVDFVRSFDLPDKLVFRHAADLDRYGADEPSMQAADKRRELAIMDRLQRIHNLTER